MAQARSNRLPNHPAGAGSPSQGFEGVQVLPSVDDHDIGRIRHSGRTGASQSHAPHGEYPPTARMSTLFDATSKAPTTVPRSSGSSTGVHVFPSGENRTVADPSARTYPSSNPTRLTGRPAAGDPTVESPTQRTSWVGIEGGRGLVLDGTATEGLA